MLPNARRSAGLAQRSTVLHDASGGAALARFTVAFASGLPVPVGIQEHAAIGGSTCSRRRRRRRRWWVAVSDGGVSVGSGRNRNLRHIAWQIKRHVDFVCLAPVHRSARSMQQEWDRTTLTRDAGGLYL